MNLFGMTYPHPAMPVSSTNGVELAKKGGKIAVAAADSPWIAWPGRLKAHNISALAGM